MTDEQITQEQYDQRVESLAEMAVEHRAEGMALSDSVWELVDGHKWIMHYSYNTRVLELAEHDPEEWRNYVADDASWRDVIQAMAYSAMEQDVFFTAQDLQG